MAEHDEDLDIRHQRMADQLWATLNEDGPGGLSMAASAVYPADLAGVLEWLEADRRTRLFLALEPHLAAEALEEMPPELRDELLESTTDDRLVAIINEASADDAIYFLDHLDEVRAQQLLGRINKQLGQQLSEQWELPDDTAGRLMTRDVVTMRPFMTAAQAIDTIRERKHPYEGAIYVVDAESKLVGVVPLRLLVIANPQAPVSEVMHKDPHAVTLESDQETVVDLMQRYHLRAVPVVDDNSHICGQITWDDAVDILEAEAEEDMLALAGTNEEIEENLGMWGRARQRLPYLLLTAIGGFVMAKLIHANTDSALGTHPILLAFLPLVPALGGNIGIQCSTITVRSIATGELRPGRMLSRAVRELGTGVLLSFILSIVCGIGAIAMITMADGESFLAAIIAVSLLLAIVIAAGFGVFIPLACQRFNIDPAIAAGPFITMLNDITGVGIYIATAVMLLNASG